MEEAVMAVERALIAWEGRFDLETVLLQRVVVADLRGPDLVGW